MELTTTSGSQASEKLFWNIAGYTNHGYIILVGRIFGYQSYYQKSHPVFQLILRQLKYMAKRWIYSAFQPGISMWYRNIWVTQRPINDNSFNLVILGHLFITVYDNSGFHWPMQGLKLDFSFCFSGKKWIAKWCVRLEDRYLSIYDKTIVDNRPQTPVGGCSTQNWPSTVTKDVLC